MTQTHPARTLSAKPLCCWNCLFWIPRGSIARGRFKHTGQVHDGTFCTDVGKVLVEESRLKLVEIMAVLVPVQQPHRPLLPPTWYDTLQIRCPVAGM